MGSNTIGTFGLDRAGKTVILNYFTTGVIITNLRPTLAVNYSNLMLLDIAMRFADMPGQQALRKVWLSNLRATSVLIYVVDTADKARYAESRTELIKMLTSRDAKIEIPLLFLFHKIDLPEAKANLTEAKAFFNIEQLKGRDVTYFETTIEDPASLKNVKDKIVAIIKKKIAI